MYFIRIKNMKRKENYIKNRSSKQQNEEKMPTFHKFILISVLIIFIIIVFESVIAVFDVYLVMSIENYWDTVLHQWYLFLVYSVFPIRDLFIAILFAYLYYYRGMKDREKERSGTSNSLYYKKMIKTIKPSIYFINPII